MTLIENLEGFDFKTLSFKNTNIDDPITFPSNFKISIRQKENRIKLPNGKINILIENNTTEVLDGLNLGYFVCLLTTVTSKDTSKEIIYDTNNFIHSPNLHDNLSGYISAILPRNGRIDKSDITKICKESAVFSTKNEENVLLHVAKGKLKGPRTVAVAVRFVFFDDFANIKHQSAFWRSTEIFSFNKSRAMSGSKNKRATTGQGLPAKKTKITQTPLTNIEKLPIQLETNNLKTENDSKIQNEFTQSDINTNSAKKIENLVIQQNIGFSEKTEFPENPKFALKPLPINWEDKELIQYNLLRSLGKFKSIDTNCTRHSSDPDIDPEDVEILVEFVKFAIVEIPRSFENSVFLRFLVAEFVLEFNSLVSYVVDDYSCIERLFSKTLIGFVKLSLSIGLSVDEIIEKVNDSIYHARIFTRHQKIVTEPRNLKRINYFMDHYQ